MDDILPKQKTPYVELWGAVFGGGKLSGKERLEQLGDVAEEVSLVLETIPVMFEAMSVGNCSDRAGDACGFLSAMLIESAQRTIELLDQDRRALERNNAKPKKQASKIETKDVAEIVAGLGVREKGFVLLIAKAVEAEKEGNLDAFVNKFIGAEQPSESDSAA